VAAHHFVGDGALMMRDADAAMEQRKCPRMSQNVPFFGVWQWDIGGFGMEKRWML